MPARRFFRFRLCFLLVLVALASIPLTWYAVNARQYAAEMSALDQVRKAVDGNLTLVRDNEYTWRRSGMMDRVTATQSWIGPKWTQALLTRLRLPIRYRVTNLTFFSPAEITDDTLAQLAAFHHVKDVILIEMSGGTTSLPSTSVPDCVRRLREIFPQAKFYFPQTQSSDEKAAKPHL